MVKFTWLFFHHLQKSLLKGYLKPENNQIAINCCFSHFTLHNMLSQQALRPALSSPLFFLTYYSLFSLFLYSLSQCICFSL